MSSASGSGEGRRAVVEGELADTSEVRTALITGETFGIKAVQYVVVDDQCIVEADISIGTEAEVAARTAELAQHLRGEVESAVVIAGSQFRWADCRVPFDIDPALPDQGRITDAIAHWEANTAYRFPLRTSANAAQFPDWVTFRPGTGCSSPVGRRTGQQFVTLAGGCPTGSVIHEIGHAVGLWHEQSREDRDAFVTIHFDKIQAGKEHNFDQHITDGDDVGAYDYGSIMHYPRDAFSRDGSDTITPVQAGAQIGQRSGLSAGDIAAANSLCTRVRPTIKERIEPGPTLKELREPVPTLKELREPGPTVKERLEPGPTLKELREPGPTLKELREPGPTAKEFREPGPFIDPRVLPGLGGRVGGGLPFAMATPHAPPPADPTAEIVAAIAELQAHLTAVAEAMAQYQPALQELQAEYAEGVALLQQWLATLSGGGA